MPVDGFSAFSLDAGSIPAVSTATKCKRATSIREFAFCGGGVIISFARTFYEKQSEQEEKKKSTR